MSQGQILLEGQSPGHFLTRMSWDVGQLRYGLEEALVMTSHISDAASAGEKLIVKLTAGSSVFYSESRLSVSKKTQSQQHYFRQSAQIFGFALVAF